MPQIIQLTTNVSSSSVKGDSSKDFTDVDMMDVSGRDFAKLMPSASEEPRARQLFARGEVDINSPHRAFEEPEYSNELPQSSLSQRLSASKEHASEARDWVETIDRMRDLLINSEESHADTETSIEISKQDQATLDEMEQWLAKLDADVTQLQSDEQLSADQQGVLSQLTQKIAEMRQVVADAQQAGFMPKETLDKATDGLMAELAQFETQVIQPHQKKQWTDIEAMLDEDSEEPLAMLSEIEMPKLNPEQKDWLTKELDAFHKQQPNASLTEAMNHIKGALETSKQFDAGQKSTLSNWIDHYQSALQKSDKQVQLASTIPASLHTKSTQSERVDSVNATEKSGGSSSSDNGKSTSESVKDEDTKPAADKSMMAKFVKEQLNNGSTSSQGMATEAELSAVSGSGMDTSLTQHTQSSAAHMSAITQTQQAMTKVDGMSVAQAQTAADKPLDLQQQETAQKLQERIQLMVSKNINRADIRLDPPELGSMHVRIHTQGDQTTVQFQVQSAQARDAIEQSMPRLREMLEQQGLNLAQSTVSEQQSGQGNESSSGRGTGFANTGDSEEPVLQLDGAVDDFLEQGRLDFYV